MYKNQSKFYWCICLILSSFTSLAFESAKDAEKSCKENTKTKIKYSICLDEKLIKAQREYKTWLTSHKIVLEDLARRSPTKSVVSEFVRSNKYYDKFMESQCRRVFFEYQGKPEAADKFRLCKIEQIAQRINQLESESAK